MLEVDYRPILVRDGVAADYPLVTAIVANSFREYERYLAQDAYAQYLDEVLQLELRGPCGRMIVAEAEGRIVGTASYHHDPTSWPPDWVSLRALGVAAEARGRGVGRRLIETCASRARVAGGKVLCVRASEAMAAAVMFLDRLGFERVREYDLPPAPDPVTKARRSGPWSWAFMLALE